MKNKGYSVLGILVLSYKWFNPLYYAMLIIAPIIIGIIEGCKKYWEALVKLIKLN